MSSSNLFDTLNSSANDTPIMSSTPIKPSQGTPGQHNTRAKHPCTTKNSFKVLNINFQSVKNKTAQLHHILDSVKPDVVAGTETWLSNDILDNEIVPKSMGYSIYRKDRKCGKGGGVMLLVKDDIICSEQPQLDTGSETIWVKVELKGNKPLFIAAHYRPKESDRKGFEELTRSIGLAKSQKADNIWILGDFNYPHFTWDNNTPSIKHTCTNITLYEDFINMLLDYNLSQVVEVPTRLSNTLDLFLTSNPSLVNRVISMPGLSDHDAVLADVNISPKIGKCKSRKVPLFHKADWEKFKSHMTDFKNKFLSNSHNNTPNDLWENFKSEIHSGIQKFVPTKTLRSKRSLPWMTQDILRTIRKRDHLHRKHKKSGKSKDREAFLKYKHLVQQKLKTAHSEYLESLLGLGQTTNDDPDSIQSKCSPKKLFSYIKNTRQDSSGIAPLRKDGLLHTDNKVKADILNSQFQSVFTQKSPLNLEQLCKVQIQNYASEGKLDSPQSCTPEYPEMPDIIISTAGIDKLLKNLQPNKAAGPDDLKPAVLKELHSEIAPILQKIFQASLNSGTLPDDWTKARVTPIYKKGDKAAASNYRPISLTCICCKLMEHIVTSNLVKHLNTNNILYDLQHGF